MRGKLNVEVMQFLNTDWWDEVSGMLKRSLMSMIFHMNFKVDGSHSFWQVLCIETSRLALLQTVATFIFALDLCECREMQIQLILDSIYASDVRCGRRQC